MLTILLSMPLCIKNTIWLYLKEISLQIYFTDILI